MCRRGSRFVAFHATDEHRSSRPRQGQYPKLGHTPAPAFCNEGDEHRTSEYVRRPTNSGLPSELGVPLRGVTPHLFDPGHPGRYPFPAPHVLPNGSYGVSRLQGPYLPRLPLDAYTAGGQAPFESGHFTGPPPPREARRSVLEGLPEAGAGRDPERHQESDGPTAPSSHTAGRSVGSSNCAADRGSSPESTGVEAWTRTRAIASAGSRAAVMDRPTTR